MNISLTIFVIFLLSLCFDNSAATNELDKTKEEVPAPVWFGPRIGRKKRALFDEGYKNIDKEELEALMEFIRKSPWTIMFFSNGKNRLMNFSPKEHSMDNLSDDEFTEMVQRSMFAPRLGRSAFFPRLGRDNEME